MDRIEEILTQRGLSKSAFAEMMGTSRQNVNALLKNPTKSSLEKIASVLGVPMWKLFASPEEVCPSDDFFAVVKRGQDVRTFDSAASLKDFCDSL